MPNSAVKPLILVVEDDPAVRNLIVAALEAHGLRHMAVETAHAAIAAASSQAPSIVLLDLGLPDMDGVKVVESVRAWSGMPIIVVSARSEDADKIRAADTVLVGFWCDKGACTPSVAALLSALHGKRVFLFGTCGFGADQSYYQQIIDCVTSNLAGDAELAGWAMCQGKMGPAVKQRYEAMLEQDPDNARFKMLLDNWVAAKDHPTKEDLDNMAAAAKKAVLGE